MDPVVSYLLLGLLSSAAVEGSVGAVKGAIRALAEADSIPGQRAAIAFAVCMGAFATIGLLSLRPDIVGRVILRLVRFPFLSFIRDANDPDQPRIISKQEADKLLTAVKDVSPLVMALLVAVSLTVASTVFSITFLGELAAAILTATGGAISGAVRRIAAWIGPGKSP